MKKSLFALAGVALCTLPATAQKPDSGAFFVRLGRDTIAIERYVRMPLQLTSEALMRTPQTRQYKLNLVFKDDGSVSWYEIQNNPIAGVPNSAPVMRSVTTFGEDSVRIESWVAAAPRAGRAAARVAGLLPLQLPFYSTYETAIMRARASGRDTATVPLLAGTTVLPFRIVFVGADSVTLSNPSVGTLRGHVDKQGRLLGLNGLATTFKVMVTRAQHVDLDRYEKKYAAADAAGRPLGPLSTRDTIDTVVGENTITINYGRPSRRGREIFGNVVPWGEVWRTGANAATGLELGGPTVIAGVAVPAGKYSLWTIPGKTEWQLIINKQTGQWGTDYDAAQDLVRIPVKPRTLSQPVETFTIDITPKQANAVMTLSWDRTQLVVPLAVAGSK